jgi:hypothetical protein
MTSTTETREALERVLELMDECAEILRGVDNDRIKAYCLADFEGRDGGWLGEFARDIIEQELEALDDDEDEEDDE